MELDAQEEMIRLAYDRTVAQYKKGIDPLRCVPENIKNLPGYDAIIKDQCLGSGAVDIKEYLKPETGMCFSRCGLLY
jgi:hypothetical protein